MIIGTQTNNNNPPFEIETFKILIPRFKKVLENEDVLALYEYFEKIAYTKILYSVFGTDWELAMSLYIAHELSLNAIDSMMPSDNLQMIANSTGAKGILNNYSVGGVYKSYGYDRTMTNKPNAIYFNSTEYGQRLMNLLATKGIPCIAVVTPE